MNGYALDANIVSYVMQNRKIAVFRFYQAAKSNIRLVLPPLVYYEIRRGLLYDRATARDRAFAKLSAYVKVCATDESEWERAAHIYAHLRRIGRPTSDADILIAAFCLVHDYVLVTNNVDHFDHVPGLKIENWANE